MTGFLYLSGENLPLAEAEASCAMRALGMDVSSILFRGRVALLDDEPPADLVKRLGMCHFGGTVVATCEPQRESVIEAVREALDTVPPGLSLAPMVRTTKKRDRLPSDELFHEMERTITSSGRRLRLRYPDRTLFVLVAEDVLVGVVTQWSDRARLASRRGSNLSFSRPVMMDPRISRSMVNLLSLPAGSRVLDPFMGPGGLIMEASMMGYDCTGIELDPMVFEGALRNIKEAGLEGHIHPCRGDSRGLGSIEDVLGRAPYDGLLTDPPFGRSSSSAGDEPDILLRSVLSSARELIVEGGPVVIDVPDEAMVHCLEGYELISVVRSRVHRSLTRHICTLRTASEDGPSTSGPAVG